MSSVGKIEQADIIPVDLITNKYLLITGNLLVCFSNFKFKFVDFDDNIDEKYLQKTRLNFNIMLIYLRMIMPLILILNMFPFFM